MEVGFAGLLSIHARRKKRSESRILTVSRILLLSEHYYRFDQFGNSKRVYIHSSKPTEILVLNMFLVKGKNPDRLSVLWKPSKSN